MPNSSEIDFVCIIGTDGSGKTTQCKRLCEKLQKEGHEAQYSWCKFESKFLYYLVQAIKKILSNKGNDMQEYDSRKKKKDSILSYQVIRIPFLSYILIHYYTQVIRDIYWPLWRGRTVVCDRYVYDTIVDIAVDFDYSDRSANRLLDMYLQFIPKPDVLLYLKVPPEVSLKRKDDIPNLEFVREKKEAYDVLLEDTSAVTISGVGDIEEIGDKINEQIWKHSD